ncbi:MAG: CsgG/HfaB family protein [candidate division WOR-3 bacterium]
MTRTARSRRRLAALVALAALLANSNCATVRPYRVTNFFRSAKLSGSEIRRVAVLPFENLTRESAAAAIVGEEFGLQLGKVGRFDLVERNRIEELWREQDLDTVFRFDPQSAARIGRMLGAQAVVLGSVTQFVPHPSVKVDTAQYYERRHRRDPDYPPVIIVDNSRDRNDALACAITAAAIITIVPVLIMLLGHKPPAAQVGASVRLVDVETGDILWQAKDAFRGDQKSVQALVEQKEDKRRLVYDVEYLTRILCQELAETLWK